MDRVEKRGDGKYREARCFQCHLARLAHSDRGVPQEIHLPGNWISQSDGAEPARQGRQGIKHRAGEEEYEIEYGCDAVEDIVAPDLQCEYRIKEKPSRGARNHSGREQRKQVWT